MKNKTLKRKYQSPKQIKMILAKVVLAITFMMLYHGKTFAQTDPTAYPEYKAVMLYHEIDVSSLEPGYYFLIVRDLYGDIINRQVLSKNCNN